MTQSVAWSISFFTLVGVWARCQDVASDNTGEVSYNTAYRLAYDGNHNSAQEMLLALVTENPNDFNARSLLASTYSWSGQFDKARKEFNKITSVDPSNRDIWISAIKNELYGENEATALGLANKALSQLKSDMEIERLREIALDRIANKKYPELGWYNQYDALGTSKPRIKRPVAKKNRSVTAKDSILGKKPEEKPLSEAVLAAREAPRNMLAINNSFTLFDQRYDPMYYSSVYFKRQTLAGSIIPRINYSNRLGKQGLQYDIDFYPKFSKRFYAYLNYGYSNASIYPNHKMGGDLYANLPGAIEFSAGGRYIITNTQNVTVITNSLGHYSGNYYFSLRSYITPKPGNLTRFSGNILARKYLRDAENYLGVNFGMGYSPELRQLTSGDDLLAETLLYVESQRLNLEYQFTGKKNPTIYRANLGVTREEFAFDAGSFFWGISAGLTYHVKF